MSEVGNAAEGMKEKEAIMDLQEYIGSGEYNGTNPPIYLMTANLAITALIKQIPKKPTLINCYGFKCPYCGTGYLKGKPKHCDNCGQKLDWSEV